MSVKPIFLFSMPRAGSTLVQRVLASHKKISTVSEPWILLPVVYALKGDEIYTNYGQSEAKIAINDLLKNIPDGGDYCDSLIRKLVLEIYEKISDAEYFLDKTPRYYLIIDDIVRIFPEAKYIYLWRNPLSIIASIIQTWYNGKFKIYRNKIDVYTGLNNLISSYIKYKDISISVNYESLVTDKISWINLFNYLEIDYDDIILEKFTSIELKGSMGDPTGTLKYNMISKENIDKWKTTINNPVRKLWAKKYIEWIGKEKMKVMGYNYEDLLNQVNSNVHSSYNYIFSDFFDLLIGSIHPWLETKIFRDKIKYLKTNRNNIIKHY